eukprot:COSAG06_NODE_35709_length_456_cov_1.271709_1_plen_38_part_01
MPRELFDERLYFILLKFLAQYRDFGPQITPTWPAVRSH